MYPVVGNLGSTYNIIITFLGMVQGSFVKMSVMVCKQTSEIIKACTLPITKMTV